MKMKIAVPVKSNGTIDDHFGHCDHFDIFSVSDDKKVTETRRIASGEGCGCKSGIAYVLAEDGVKLMLAGGIGQGAVNVLHHPGIAVVRGCTGNAELNVKQYLSGELIDSGENCSHPHDHHHERN